MNCEKWNKIDLFIGMEEDPLKKYENYFEKIEFNKCNYSFIIPEPFSDLFASFYTKILKDTFIVFPKDFKQAKELLNDYGNEMGIEENWIVISPCMELEKNIKSFQENKNIICFIGYCPIFNHKHDELFLYSFSKYDKIFNSCNELIEELFKLSNIFYYRKKQNYKINNNNVDDIKLKYDSKFLIDIKEKYLEEAIIEEKLCEFYDFKILNNDCYFTFIKSLNFLTKCLHEKNYNLMNDMNEILKRFIIITFIPFEKELTCTMILRQFHLLYLYFSNYPYLYGTLTDEEIDQIFKEFHNMDKNKVNTKLAFSFNSLTNCIGLITIDLNNGKSILEEKERLKNFQKLLIEFNCACDQFNLEIDIEKFTEYYQIKNYFRDIDFCLYQFMKNTLGLCKNYPLISEINHYKFLENRFRNYKEYCLHFIKDNITPENEQEKLFNQSIRYNHTIVIGDKNFLDIIDKMKLPCKKIFFI